MKDIRFTQRTAALDAELEWLKYLIKWRLEFITETPNAGNFQETDLREVPLPELPENNDYYDLVHEMRHYAGEEASYEREYGERCLMALCFAVHLNPYVFTPMTALESRHPAHALFGDYKNPYCAAFQPSLETALFLLAHNDVALRQYFLQLFLDENHPLNRYRVVIRLQEAEKSTIEALVAPLDLSEEWTSLLVMGRPFIPRFGPTFPAQQVKTGLEWEDLVLGSDTRFALEELNIWLKERGALYKHAQLNRKVKKGFRALFYGPSGTGKTLTAGLIGKEAGQPVFKVDLSVVISKYIGETEKNLARIFDRAENKNWILFFDEADALFGKRTQTHSSNDRYANQEVSFLLQRIENYDGMIILSSNLKSNMDPAFIRRFQSIIKFRMPNKTLRCELFRRTFVGDYQLEDEALMEQVADKYSFNGAEIDNIYLHCALMTSHLGHKKVSRDTFSGAVMKELRKKGKSI